MPSVSSPFDAAEFPPAAAPDVGPPPMRHWRLTRRCSITPRRFMLHLCAMAAVLVGLAFALSALGSPSLAALCLVQVVVLLCTGLHFAVHAADGEQVVLYPDRLVVRHYDGLVARSYSLNPRFAHFECGRGADEGYYWLRHGDIRVPMGHQLPPVRRCLAVAEITTALLGFHP
ncbi:MAG: Protein of unknown function transrane [Rhodoferax sp.]|nr:Protein of unknown function transrane [Rhodoferax sp.]